MKLQQLRFVLAIAEHDLNISKAAKHLYTSQPGVSRQLRLLEEELDISIFVRNGKQLVDTTAQGKIVLEKFAAIMDLVGEIKSTAATEVPQRVSFSDLPQLAQAS
jgi:LysR family transcriptional regulator, cys regulon transcriptional activator